MTSHTFATMGTVASLTLQPTAPQPTALTDTVQPDTALASVLVGVETVFRGFDDRYSLYRPETELARVASGELALADTSAELRESYALALEWRDRSGGAFTPHRADGVIDLSGLVKALAMRAAGEALVSAGSLDWCLNVGGDILVNGSNGDVGAWIVGIVDPDARGELLTSVALAGGPSGRLALATSGSAERGEHIWTSSHSAPEFIQVSVAADDIVTADVLATAIVAGGEHTLELVTGELRLDVLTVDRERRLRMTPGMAGAMRRANGAEPLS